MVEGDNKTQTNNKLKEKILPNPIDDFTHPPEHKNPS